MTERNKYQNWRKALASGTQNCVEVATAGTVGVRDSKDPAGAILEFSTGDWRRFIAGIGSGTS